MPKSKPSPRARKGRIVENLKSAASVLGVSPEVVRRAKEAGCPAFYPGNRIAVDELRKWIAEHSEELKSQGPVSLKDQKLNEEIRKLRILNDTKEAIVVSRAKVAGAIQKCISDVRRILEQRLESEYPSMVSGLDVQQARVFGKRLTDLIVSEFRKLGALWGNL